jgi:hypothetical protein
LGLEMWDFVWGVLLGHILANISGETLLRREIDPETDAPPIQAQHFRMDKPFPRVTYPVSTGFRPVLLLRGSRRGLFWGFLPPGFRQKCRTSRPGGFLKWERLKVLPEFREGGKDRYG